ncbi:MAG: hypothetical protein ABH877_04310 [bacterium]
MSFRCEGCEQPQEPRARPNRVVVSYRTIERNGRPATQVAVEANYCDECARSVEVARAEIAKDNLGVRVAG